MKQSLDFSSFEERSWHSKIDGHALDVPALALPDNGILFKTSRMKEMGWMFYQDSQHPEREYPTRWYFREKKTYLVLLEKIKKRGFVISDIPHLL